MDKITVCNMALGMLGDVSKAKRMTTMSRTGTELPVHHVVLDFYDECKDRMLAAREWSRTTTVVPLTQSADDPVLDGQWSYKYVLPPDCVILRAVLDHSGREYERDVVAEQRIAGGQTFYDQYIYANLDDALARYTFRVGEEQYLPGMALLHAKYLAEAIVMSTTAKATDAVLLSREIERRYERMCIALGSKEGYVENEKGSRQYTDLY